MSKKMNIKRNELAIFLHFDSQFDFVAIFVLKTKENWDWRPRLPTKQEGKTRACDNSTTNVNISAVKNQNKQKAKFLEESRILSLVHGNLQIFDSFLSSKRMEGGDEEFQVYFSTQQLKESQMNPGVWWLNESQRKIPELDGLLPKCKFFWLANLISRQMRREQP